MAAPEVIVIAGPSGSGKSRHFPVDRMGVAGFNVDDRCAHLNGGTYSAIPPGIRAQAQRECEEFIATSIEHRASFAVETTLRTDVAIRQALHARSCGFVIRMIFVATDDVEDNIRRIELRGLDGGHSAPPDRVREIYMRSLANLAIAMPIFDELLLFDNSTFDEGPRLVARLCLGVIVERHGVLPRWLSSVLPAG